MNICLRLFLAVFLTISSSSLRAETVEKIRFGDMDSWITRNITESRLLGGNKKTVYAIGPDATVEGPVAYVPADKNPWASSNVLANVMGIIKTSNTVSPGVHPGHGRCAVLRTKIEHCKVIGLVNINVLVGGSIFLGRMFEPLKSTSNPYSKMEMGVPFTRRPKFLQFDYKVYNPGTGMLTYADGKKTKTYPGNDEAEVFILLQKRWEDADGTLFAERVGTGRERYGKTTAGWVEGHRMPVLYGDITAHQNYHDCMQLIPENHCYYARNSKGKMVPVKEVGWAAEGEQPTHIMLMASSGCGDAYVGTEGMEFSVDNLALVFE